MCIRDSIYINFCNPWSKNASSNKHRLTYPRQLIQYREFLKDGGEIYFKMCIRDRYSTPRAAASLPTGAP